MQLFHQNVAGILNKSELFEITLSELCKEIGDIDCICISETFMRLGSERNLKIPNYNLASCFSRKQQRRGGTCILIKHGLAYTPLKTTLDLCVPYYFECCGVELPDFNLIIVCIYRIPGHNVELFIYNFRILLTKLTHKEKKKIILCGDWNIDILKNCNQTKDLNSLLTNFGFSIHVKSPTRKKSCIDLIASNLGSQSVSCNTHRLALSDHDTGQSISIQISKLSESKQNVQYYTEQRRDYCQQNIDMFCKHISCLSFSQIYAAVDCNSAFDEFHDLIILLFNLCFPILNVRVYNKQIKNKWLTNGLKKCCIKKRQLYFKYHAENSNKRQNKQKYVTYSKVLKKCICMSQQLNNIIYINKSKNKGKATWNVIKHNLNMNTNLTEIKNIKSNGEVCDNRLRMCNIFNEHFTSRSHVKTNINIHNQYIRTVNNSIFLSPLDQYDVVKIIKSLKDTNSTGYDEIPTKLLKQCVVQIALPLSYLINFSFEQGCFPNRLKLTIVKPLFKKGDPSEIKNYRPIALIPVLSKIFEKAMYNKINNFFDKANIIHPNQYGFRKDTSTSDACLTLVRHITESLNNNQCILGVFIDMSQAFDCVCHNTLLSKLEKYGIRGKAIDWLKSYLSERKQYTELSEIVNNKKNIYKSLSKPLHCGVPQGSVLGPLLFLAYINDLPNALKHTCILFADDATLIIKSDNNSELENEAINELNTTTRWLNDNGLQLNLSKTKIVQFKTRNSISASINVHCNHSNIQIVNSTTFLGVTLDEHLNWKAHVENVCLRLDRFVFALRRLRSIASKEAAMSAYHGYVSSVLRYGLVIWGNSTEIHRAFITQKKCVRAVNGSAYLAHCKPIFQELNILPLPCLYILETTKFVKRNPALFPRHDEVINKTRPSRRPLRLYQPPQRLKVSRSNAYSMAIRLFNHVPEEYKNLPLNQFRKKMFKWLLEKCFYSVADFLNTF